MKMQKKIQIFIQQYHMIERGDRVVAGVSGGADSVCLLRMLCLLQQVLGFSLSAVHVEHGIRGEESLQDAEFVRELCEKWHVPLQSFSVDAPARAKEKHQSLEEAARELRYECFYRVCREKKANRLAVAHHGDDCAETMLFHLSRGTGIRGLCGIVPVRHVPEHGVDLIRPLLCLTRSDIETILDELGQEYRTDSTNADETMSRNRIRGLVLPQLRQINPAAVPHMVRTAGYMEEVCAYIDQAAWELGKSYIQYLPDKSEVQEIRIERQGLLHMPEILQENLLHRLLGELAGSRKDITAVHVEKVRELFFMPVGRQIDLPYQMQAVTGYESVVLHKKTDGKDTMKGQRQDHQKKDGRNEDDRGRKGRNEEKCTSAQKKDSAPESVEELLDTSGNSQEIGGLEITARIFLFDGKIQQIPEKTYTKWFDYDKIKDTVQIRTRRAGDYLQIRSTGGHKKLKDYLIDSKIPQKERDSLVLLAEGSHILWVIGLRISEAYKVTQETKRILEVCVNGGKEENE